MSDVEIIEAMRLSDPTLLGTPAGILSIISHYNRPDVYVFRGYSEVIMYHHTIEEPFVKTLETSNWSFDCVSRIIGAIGDIIYLEGIDKKDYILLAFDMRTCVLTYRCKMRLYSSICISSSGDMYMYDTFGNFYKFDPTTLVETKLPSITRLKTECQCFYHNGSVYALGGTNKNFVTTKHCERFDIRENKWYTITSSPSPLTISFITVKDESLIITAIRRNKSVFVYNTEEDKWTTVKWDKDFTKLPLRMLQYNRGKFYALTGACGHNPMNVIWETDSPEQPWRSILEMAIASSHPKLRVYLNNVH